jgi:hypothetical protein
MTLNNQNTCDTTPQAADHIPRTLLSNQTTLALVVPLAKVTHNPIQGAGVTLDQEAQGHSTPPQDPLALKLLAQIIHAQAAGLVTLERLATVAP